MNPNLKVYIDNMKLNANMVNYCYNSCFKDASSTSEGEKNCMSTCISNYQLLDRLYILNCSFDSLFKENITEKKSTKNH